LENLVNRFKSVLIAVVLLLWLALTGHALHDRWYNDGYRDATIHARQADATRRTVAERAVLLRKECAQ
jgi:23S rRNA G2445 N2-methylase RlmL